MRLPCRFLLFSALLAVLALDAETGSVNFSKEQSQLNDKKAIPGMDKRFNGGEMPKAGFNNVIEHKKWGQDKQHAFNTMRWRQADSDSGISTTNRYETTVLQYDELPKKWYVDNGKEAWVENIGVMKEVVTASKFKNAQVYQYPVDTYEKISQHIDEMSMQDVNRFNFRRNHSSEPGLPVEEAGDRKDWLKEKGEEKDKG